MLSIHDRQFKLRASVQRFSVRIRWTRLRFVAAFFLFLACSHCNFKVALLDAMEPRLAMVYAIAIATMLRVDTTEVFFALKHILLFSNAQAIAIVHLDAPLPFMETVFAILHATPARATTTTVSHSPF